jgi:hypothetical protein
MQIYGGPVPSYGQPCWDVWVSCDGQCDAPEFSAKFVPYIILDSKTNKIIYFVMLQKEVDGADLENIACENTRALDC